MATATGCAARRMWAMKMLGNSFAASRHASHTVLPATFGVSVLGGTMTEQPSGS